MLVKDALKHFKNNQSAMAVAAGSSYSSVYASWGSVVPWGSAWLLHVFTSGKLTVDLKYYDGKEIKQEFKRKDAYMQKYRAQKKQQDQEKKAPN